MGRCDHVAQNAARTVALCEDNADIFQNVLLHPGRESGLHDEVLHMDANVSVLVQIEWNLQN